MHLEQLPSGFWVRRMLGVLFGRRYYCARMHPHATEQARRECILSSSPPAPGV